MKLENFLLIGGFLLIFGGVSILIASAFFPILITNHLIFYCSASIIIIIGLLSTRFGKKLISSDKIESKVRLEYLLIVVGFLLIFGGVSILISSAFFPMLISNHLVFYSLFSTIVIIGILLSRTGKILLARN